MTGRQDKFDKAHITLYLIGLIPATWLGLLIAPYMGDGLAGFLLHSSEIFNNPFHITPCEGSLRDRKSVV